MSSSSVTNCFLVFMGNGGCFSFCLKKSKLDLSCPGAISTNRSTRWGSCQSGEQHQIAISNEIYRHVNQPDGCNSHIN